MIDALLAGAVGLFATGVVYLGLTWGIAWYMDAHHDDFLLALRRIGWWCVGLSLPMAVIAWAAA